MKNSAASDAHRVDTSVFQSDVTAELRRLERLLFELLGDQSKTQGERISLLARCGFDNTAIAEFVGTSGNVVGGQLRRAKSPSRAVPPKSKKGRAKLG